jgi:hypothetical protein
MYNARRRVTCAIAIVAACRGAAKPTATGGSFRVGVPDDTELAAHPVALADGRVLAVWVGAPRDPQLHEPEPVFVAQLERDGRTSQLWPIANAKGSVIGFAASHDVAYLAMQVEKGTLRIGDSSVDSSGGEDEDGPVALITIKPDAGPIAVQKVVSKFPNPSVAIAGEVGGDLYLAIVDQGRDQPETRINEVARLAGIGKPAWTRELPGPATITRVTVVEGGKGEIVVEDTSEFGATTLIWLDATGHELAHHRIADASGIGKTPSIVRAVKAGGAVVLFVSATTRFSVNGRRYQAANAPALDAQNAFDQLVFLVMSSNDVRVELGAGELGVMPNLLDVAVTGDRVAAVIETAQPGAASPAVKLVTDPHDAKRRTMTALPALTQSGAVVLRAGADMLWIDGCGGAPRKGWCAHAHAP